jgi:uncharacterized protein YprB with RNaseH-like and TPR domain
MEENLYAFDTNCPKCGGQTTEKQIGLATFIMCKDPIKCDYYKIKQIDSIINNPSDERIKREKEWYEQRFRLFIRREKDKIKAEFIAKEIERLKKEYHDQNINGESGNTEESENTKKSEKSYTEDNIKNENTETEDLNKEKLEKIPLLYYDIETTGLDPKKNPIISFASLDSSTGLIEVLEDDNGEKTLLENIKSKLEQSINEDKILIGYNSIFFDLPYIFTRFKVNEIEHDFNVSEYQKLNEIVNKKQDVVDIKYNNKKLQHVDFLIAIKTHYEQFNKFKLDDICKQLKIPSKTKITGLPHEQRETDHDKFIEYAEQDVRVLDIINKKLDIINLLEDIAKESNSDISQTM